MKFRDDFKLRFTKKPEFTVDTKNKTVKCYITCTVYVPTSLSSILYMENFQTFAKGYAKCDGKDKFDPEVGKRIALARAESKIYWKVRTEVNKVIENAKRFIEGGQKFVTKAYRVIGHNQMYIDKYCASEKKTTSEILSEKAKSQTRDEKGRFTACTKTEDSCKMNDNNKEKQGYDKKCYNNNKCKDNTGVIRITINRI